MERNGGMEEWRNGGMEEYIKRSRNISITIWGENNYIRINVLESRLLPMETTVGDEWKGRRSYIIFSTLLGLPLVESPQVVPLPPFYIQNPLKS